MPDLGGINWPGGRREETVWWEEGLGGEGVSTWGEVLGQLEVERERPDITYPSRATLIDRGEARKKGEANSRKPGTRDRKKAKKLFPVVQGSKKFQVGAPFFRGSIICDLLGLPLLVACTEPPLETTRSSRIATAVRTIPACTCKAQEQQHTQSEKRDSWAAEQADIKRREKSEKSKIGKLCSQPSLSSMPILASRQRS